MDEEVEREDGAVGDGLGKRSYNGSAVRVSMQSVIDPPMTRPIRINGHELGHQPAPVSSPQPFQARNHPRRAKLSTKLPCYQTKTRPGAIDGRPKKDIESPDQSINGWNRRVSMFDWLFDHGQKLNGGIEGILDQGEEAGPTANAPGAPETKE